MIHTLKDLYHKKPLQMIVFIAVLARIVAAIFSQGYGMHDDHFLVIESSASWVDGYDYKNWLPWSPLNEGHPEGHSFTYVGINFIYFYLCKLIGLSDPKLLMLINRLIHAFFSLIVVIYGYRITEKLSNNENAKTVGWLLALLWVVPFVSVHNLVEFAAVPFLMIAVWLIVKDQPKYLIAGLYLGLAISFRYQIAIFAIGIGLYLLFQKELKNFLLLSLGGIISFSLTQGVVDFFIWGYPFAEFLGYVKYNMNEGVEYMPNSNYFMYFFVLTGIFFVPLGILMLFGFFRSYKKYFLLFLPTFLFILFHTFFPNRQERFILSVIPFFIILGVIGYSEFNFKRQVKLWSVSLRIFWVINSILLLFTTTMYSKRSRVEAMYSLYGKVQKEDVWILMEGSAGGTVEMAPKFYGKLWASETRDRTNASDPLRVENKDYDFIFFFEEEKLDERITAYKTIYPQMELHSKCEPSFVDALLHKINPRNSNEYIEVWRTNFKAENP